MIMNILESLFGKGTGFVVVYLIVAMVALIIAVLSKKDRLYKFFSVLLTVAVLSGVALLFSASSCGQDDTGCGLAESLYLIFIVVPLLIISSIYLTIAYFLKKKRGQQLQWYNHLFLTLGWFSMLVMITFWYIEEHPSLFRNQPTNVIQERN